MLYQGKSHEETNECLPYDPLIKVDCLAKAYIPTQNICKVFSETDSLKVGTIFPELYKPYVSRYAKKGGVFNG